VVRGRVIGADGLRSVVARRLGLLRRPPRLRKIALTAHLEGVAVPSGWGELRASAGGCVGIALVDDRIANVTVVVTAPRRQELAGDPEAYFDAAVRRYGVTGRRVDRVLATGPFDCPMRDVAAEGALLVGDAAGYYDPFTGQGIYRALRGAELAAGAVLGGPTSASLRAYSREVRREFSPGERLQHLVEAFVSRPRLLGWAARRLERRPALGDALIRATGDLAHPRTLLRPALLAQLAF
jgi:menaquinone-9 beta-reductase